MDDDDIEALEAAQELSIKHPIPPDLRERVESWIEPHTMDCSIDHANVVEAIEQAYPLILAHHGIITIDEEN